MKTNFAGKESLTIIYITKDETLKIGYVSDKDNLGYVKLEKGKSIDEELANKISRCFVGKKIISLYNEESRCDSKYLFTSSANLFSIKPKFPLRRGKIVCEQHQDI